MDQSLLTSRAIIGAYFARVESATLSNWVPLVSDLFLSDQEAETYAFAGAVPALREFIGGRQAKGLLTESFTLRNKRYEATMEVRRQDVLRDKSGQIMARVGEFADGSARHWLGLLSELIASGETQRCYDGQFFFSTQHQSPRRPAAVQSNSVTMDISTIPPDGPFSFFGTTTNPTMYEARGTIFRALQAIWSVNDDHGEPLNEYAREFLVLVPPTLYAPFKVACDSINEMGTELSLEAGQAAAAGLREGPSISVQIGINPRLNWSDKVAVFRTDTPTKALIRQSEQDVRLLVKGEASEFEFEQDAWQFGIDASRTVGFGMWQRACLVQMI